MNKHLFHSGEDDQDISMLSDRDMPDDMFFKNKTTFVPQALRENLFETEYDDDDDEHDEQGPDHQKKMPDEFNKHYRLKPRQFLAELRRIPPAEWAKFVQQVLELSTENQKEIQQLREEKDKKQRKEDLSLGKRMIATFPPSTITQILMRLGLNFVAEELDGNNVLITQLGQSAREQAEKEEKIKQLNESRKKMCASLYSDLDTRLQHRTIKLIDSFATKQKLRLEFFPNDSIYPLYEQMNVAKQCWEMAVKVGERQPFSLPAVPHAGGSASEMLQTMMTAETWLVTAPNNPFDILGFITGEPEEMLEELQILKIQWVAAKSFAPNVIRLLLMKFLAQNNMEGFQQVYISWFPDDVTTVVHLRALGFERFDQAKKFSLDRVDFVLMPETILLIEPKKCKKYLFGLAPEEEDEVKPNKLTLTAENSDYSRLPQGEKNRSALKIKRRQTGPKKKQARSSSATNEKMPTVMMPQDEKICDECGEEIPDDEPYINCNYCRHGFRLCIFCSEVKGLSHHHIVDLVEPGVKDWVEEAVKQKLGDNSANSQEMENIKHTVRAEAHDKEFNQFVKDMTKGKTQKYDIPAPDERKVRPSSKFDLLPEASGSAKIQNSDVNLGEPEEEEDFYDKTPDPNPESDEYSSEYHPSHELPDREQLTAVRWLQYKQQLSNSKKASFWDILKWRPNLTWGAWGFFGLLSLSFGNVIWKRLL